MIKKELFFEFKKNYLKYYISTKEVIARNLKNQIVKIVQIIQKKI